MDDADTVASDGSFGSKDSDATIQLWSDGSLDSDEGSSAEGAPEYDTSDADSEGDAEAAEGAKLSPSECKDHVDELQRRVAKFPQPLSMDFVKRFIAEGGDGGDGAAGAGGDGAAADDDDGDVRQPVGLNAGVALHDYQLQGHDWLVRLHDSGLGGVLGDEMGLGKTIQAISLISHHIKGSDSPVLVVCPLSLVLNWEAEFQKFCSSIRVVVYHAEKEARLQLQSKIRDGAMKFDVLITTYGTTISDHEFLGSFRWGVTIVDEAQRLKNHRSRLFKVLHRSFKRGQCVLLTGTPVQNNLKELWSLLHFIAPEVFTSHDGFVSFFTGDITKTGGIAHADILQQILKRVMLRRTKADVDLQLPSLTEVVVEVTLTAMQRKWYKGVLAGNTDALTAKASTGLNNIIMQLRKVCNHPYLFEGAEPEPFYEGDHIFENAGKLRVLNKLLPHLKENGHKVLLFSQFTSMLDIVQDFLSYKSLSYERLDGSVRGQERWKAIKRFSGGADSPFCFMLSTRAGGVGLNLADADVVILLDTDWNPQMDLQAIGRAYRLGQERPVRVLRLVTSGTVEEVMLKRSIRKLRLSQSALGGGVLAGSGEQLKANKQDATTLMNVVKFGLNRLDDVDDAAAMDESVEAILERAKPINLLQAQSSLGSDDPKDSTVKVLDVDEFLSTDDSADIHSEGEADAEDSDALDALLEEAKLPEALPSRLGDRGGGSARLVAVKRKAEPLSDEEKARRKRARQEREAREEAEKQAKREALWVKNGYTSHVLPDPDTDDESEAAVSTGVRARLALKYVAGDATRPKVAAGQALTPTIVIHCVNTSGYWGRGGMFSALDRRSLAIGEAYEASKTNKDLRLGDVHLIPVQSDDAGGGAGSAEAYVALIACLKRRSGNMSLVAPELENGLKKLAHSAKSLNATVHTPRIGDGLDGMSWYMVERIFRKGLASRGVPTFVYYFSRRRATRPSTPAANDAAAAANRPVDTRKRFDGLSIDAIIELGKKEAGDDAEQYANVAANVRFMSERTATELRGARVLLVAQVATLSTKKASGEEYDETELRMTRFYSQFLESLLRAARHRERAAAIASAASDSAAPAGDGSV